MLTERLNAAYLRVDTIEQTLRDLHFPDVQSEGYEIMYRVASDNLILGINVVADSCNPVELTRNQWMKVAEMSGSQCVNIEVICSDPNEHRARVQNRSSTVKGLRLPTWEEVESREYEPWSRERLVIDTAGKLQEESFEELWNALRLPH